MRYYGGDMKNRALDWLAQAENDFLWAQETHECGRYAQVSFICQQLAEKAVKSIAYSRGIEMIKSHSISEIAKSLNINGDIEMMAKRLDMYYISSRYPDAFPSGAPFEYFSIEQSTEALSFAQKILDFVKKVVHEK
jgi:HEPN domain-containing protein